MKLHLCSIFLLFTFALPSWAFGQSQTVLFLGDSLTAGYGVKKEEAYPHLIEMQLKEKSQPVQIINGSVSGSLSSSGPKRLEFYLKRTQPDIVIIALGGNDARQGTPPEEIKKSLEKTIQTAKGSDVKIILAGMQIFSNYGKEYRAKFAEIYPSLARKYKVQLIPFLLEKVAGKKDLNQKDGFHPNPKGHKIIAETVLPYIEKLL